MARSDVNAGNQLHVSTAELGLCGNSSSGVYISWRTGEFSAVAGDRAGGSRLFFDNEELDLWKMLIIKFYQDLP